jgi:hypothetical protein
MVMDGVGMTNEEAADLVFRHTGHHRFREWITMGQPYIDALHRLARSYEGIPEPPAEPVVNSTAQSTPMTPEARQELLITIDQVKAISLCRQRSVDGCGCGGRGRCGLGKGRDGIVYHPDCLACIRSGQADLPPGTPT